MTTVRVYNDMGHLMWSPRILGIESLINADITENFSIVNGYGMRSYVNNHGVPQSRTVSLRGQTYILNYDL